MVSKLWLTGPGAISLLLYLAQSALFLSPYGSEPALHTFCIQLIMLHFLKFLSKICNYVAGHLDKFKIIIENSQREKV